MAQKKFDYSIDFASTDFRKNPELYVVGKGEQGVLLVEPYKSELLPHWRFKTPAIAKDSSTKLYDMFIKYRDQHDIVGMDMARKFIQMGYTRAKRYANHKSGKKYLGPVPLDKKGQSGAHGRAMLPLQVDEEKAAAAEIFLEVLTKVKADLNYKDAKEQHLLTYNKA